MDKIVCELVGRYACTEAVAEAVLKADPDADGMLSAALVATPHPERRRAFEVAFKALEGRPAPLFRRVAEASA